MSFTAKDVLHRARITLNDASSVRWTLPELLNYLNDGLREISLQKPSATAVTAVIDLAAGCKQVIPATYHSLIQVVRNDVRSGGVASSSGGPAITPIAREAIDTMIPGWHATATLPFTEKVTHVLDEIMDQRTFYVVPGNDGTGAVLAIVSAYPTPVASPTNPLDINEYSATVDLKDIYQNALVDYMLYRAFSKDTDIATSGQRASAHYGLFQGALGIKKQNEAAENVNTTYRTA